MLRFNTCLFSRVCSVYLQIADVKIKHLFVFKSVFSLIKVADVMINTCLFSRVFSVYLQVADV